MLIRTIQHSMIAATLILAALPAGAQEARVEADRTDEQGEGSRPHRMAVQLGQAQRPAKSQYVQPAAASLRRMAMK